MAKHLFILSIITSLILSSCERKPDACLDFGDALEAGTTIRIESCSDNYEFLTWEFNDGRGQVGDYVERQFDKEGSYSVLLTAYSDGAYRSDEVSQDFKASFRYIDRFEVIGESGFPSLEVRVEEEYTSSGGDDGRWTVAGSDGTFTADAPFQVLVWPDLFRVMPTSRTLQLYGRQGLSRTFLGEQKFNFQSVKDNPVTLESEDGKLQMKMYWRYKY